MQPSRVDPAVAPTSLGVTTVNGPTVAFSLPDGASKAVWEFTSIGENDDHEVCTHNGRITAWRTGAMTDANGEVTVDPSVWPAWAEEPTVDGAGRNVTLALLPADATWTTTLRLIARS